jgi:DNA polymerase III subunit delta
MAQDREPEVVLRQLRNGELNPVYLFYGESHFRLEKVLTEIRNTFVPENARDLNMQLFYGGETQPSTILDAARSLPFMATNRLIIVRRAEKIAAASLESFLPYLEDPVPSTCLIFVMEKPNFRTRFSRKMREKGWSVEFRRLRDHEIVPWLLRTGKGMGIDLDGEASAFLFQMVGNRLQDLHAELEKLLLRYGEGKVGRKEVRDLAVFSRAYTVFELIDEISSRRAESSLLVLRRFLQEEDKTGALRVLGMLNRQIRLISHTKRVLEGGGKLSDLPKKVGIPGFLGKKIAQQSRKWEAEELEAALHLLYRSDGLLKRGSSERTVLETLVLQLCWWEDQEASI